MRIIVIGLFVAVFLKFVYTCTINTVQHANNGGSVVLQFKALIVNPESDTLFATNVIRSPNGSALFTILYTNGATTQNPTCNGCTFVGDKSTGNISIRLDNLQAVNGGTYKLQSGSESTKCVIVHVLGEPETPTITDNNSNSEGEDIVLECNSKSTTVPTDSNLGLHYKWKVNNVPNPVDPRYTYTQNKLTISDLVKEDGSKQFICAASESGPGVIGLSSLWSGTFMFAVIYGPEAGSLKLIPAALTYTEEEGTSISDITCSTDCYPKCTYKWSKTSTSNVVSSTGTLHLGTLYRNEAAKYICTATNPNKSGNDTIQVTVNVRYGPDVKTTTLSPGHSSYIQEENSFLGNITCSADCYPDCNYQWTKTGNVIVSRNRVLSLGTLKRNEASTYTCTVTNPHTSGTVTKAVTVGVNYGPDLSTTRLSPTNLTYTIEEGSILPDITCIGDCFPACRYRWTKPGNMEAASGDILSLGRLSRDTAAVYTCSVTNKNTSGSVTKNVTINVIYGPDPNSVTLDPEATAYVLNELEPLADITCGAHCYPSCNFEWTKSDTNNQVSSTQKLQLGTLNRTKADTYTCIATNPTVRKNATKSIIVKVRYGPDICKVSAPSQYRVTEGTTPQGILCQSECYPSCSYKWKNISNGTFITQTGTFLLGTVAREHAGIYKCFCKNTASQYQKEQNTSVKIIVQYPPDVSIISSPREYMEGNSLNLTCDAKGNPSTYIYSGFEQTFGDSIIHNGHLFINGTLHIPTLQLQDTGNYTCYVNNGVKSPSGELKDSTNSTFVGVQVRPKTLKKQLRFAGTTHETAFIQAKLYSYPDIKNVTFVRYDGFTITNVSNSKYEINIYKTVVENYFYNTYVSLDGSFLNMSISDLQEEDFGNYTLVLENEIGTTNATIFLDAESVPSEPKDFVYSYEDSSHKFCWVGGFNGGHSQTFVIQTSIAGLDEWVNQTSVIEKEQSQYSANISYISPGTYTARIFAWNIKGPSNYVGLNETFKIEEDISDGNMSAVIGGVAGGSSALIIIILGIVVVVILKRRGVFSKGKAHAHDDKNDRKPVYEDENDYGMQDNPMYVSAGPRNLEHNAGGSGDAGAVYSTVDKKKLVVDSNKSDVYAEVDKSKKTKKIKDLSDSEYSTPVKPKGKKEKKEKSNRGFMKDKKGKKMMQEGDVYENATTTELKDRQKKTNKNDEIIYENPEPSKPAEKKNVNKDGLIYADLTFNDQPKGQKKLVIHGLDSMTEYVQVDFTKKADPLPDSDDENNPPKK